MRSRRALAGGLIARRRRDRPNADFAVLLDEFGLVFRPVLFGVPGHVDLSICRGLSTHGE